MTFAGIDVSVRNIISSIGTTVLIFDRFLDSLIDDDDGGCRSSISRILASRLNSLALLASAILARLPVLSIYTLQLQLSVILTMTGWDCNSLSPLAE